MVCSTNGPERTGPLAKLEVLKTLFITSTCIAAASYSGSNCILVLCAGSTKGFQSEASEEILGIRLGGFNLLISDGETSVILEKIIRPKITVISNQKEETMLRRKMVINQLADGCANFCANFAIAEAWLKIHINDLLPRIKYPSFGCIKNALDQASNGAKSFALSQNGDDRRVGLKLSKGLRQRGFASTYFEAIKDAWKVWKADQKAVKYLITTPIEDLVDENTLRILKKIK